MKNSKHLLLVFICIAFVTIGYAQHRRYKISNGFAIGGGLTQFDILTDNFNTTKGNGWLISASATGDLPHKWYNISYGMQLSENTLEITGAEFDEEAFRETQIEYKLMAVQLSLLFHVKVIPNFITLDLGPVIQYNGKLEMQSSDEENLFVTLAGSETVLAKNLEDISQFNVNGAVGATLGFKFIKFRAQYIYGFTNMLNKLNDQEFNSGAGKSDFKGNQSMLTFSALITF